MKRLVFIALIVMSCTAVLAAQPALERGDVLVTTHSFEEDIGRILVFSRSGRFKGNLISVANRGFGDLFFRDDLVYVASGGIWTVNRSGQLAPFAAVQPSSTGFRWISPGPAGGVIGVGTVVLNQFAADGTLVRSRLNDPLTSGDGIDLASDGCTLYQNHDGRLARWDACLDSPVTFFGSSQGPASRELRILPDGTFLVALWGASPYVVHLDSNGNLIRDYPLTGEGLALDIDGTSYWRGFGCHLRRIDIATGAILTISEDYPNCGDAPLHIAVVGEPRPGLPASAAAATAIPTVSPAVLALLALTVAVVALAKLRVG